jgi:hypothetical protein
VAGEIVEGVQAEAVLDRLLGQPGIAWVDSRNLLHGCYMFSIERVAPVTRTAP